MCNEIVCHIAWEVGVRRTWYKLAPAITTPSGTPCPSVSTLRFTPRLPRSVGLALVTSPETCQAIQQTTTIERRGVSHVRSISFLAHQMVFLGPAFPCWSSIPQLQVTFGVITR
jgi:hypothetical protein